MTTEKRKTIMGWHNEKKIIIALITAVLITLITSLGQWFYVIKTLDTDPPLINRIIALEYKASEQGRTNQKILDVLEDLRQDSRKFRQEQSRRTPMIKYIEKKMGVE